MTTMSDLLKLAIAALIPIAIVGMLVLYVATIYTIDKTRERIACYEAAITVQRFENDCGNRNWIERAVIWINRA